MTIRTENPLAYKSWWLMRERCDNSALESWRYYGGRGIRYVMRWRLFENFLADMGERPPGYSLERRNVNGHYGPRNCIWIPKAEQAINRRRAYNPASGWQVGTLDALFPPLPPDIELPAVVIETADLQINPKNL